MSYNERIKGGIIMREYRLSHFLIDIALTVLTAGFWLIWIFIREMRNVARRG